jgi:hypothetical protein
MLQGLCRRRTTKALSGLRRRSQYDTQRERYHMHRALIPEPLNLTCAPTKTALSLGRPRLLILSSAFLCVCVYVCMCVCVYVCMCICMYVCMCIYGRLSFACCFLWSSSALFEVLRRSCIRHIFQNVFTGRFMSKICC